MQCTYLAFYGYGREARDEFLPLVELLRQRRRVNCVANGKAAWAGRAVPCMAPALMCTPPWYSGFRASARFAFCLYWQHGGILCVCFFFVTCRRGDLILDGYFFYGDFDLGRASTGDFVV